MTILRVSGAKAALNEKSAASRENSHQLLRGNHFKLSVSAIARLLIEAPPSKLRHVAKTRALHVLVCDLDHQLWPNCFPREIFSIAPATLPAWHPLAGFRARRRMLRPASPWMMGEGAFAVRSQKLDQFHPLLGSETGAHADVLQRI